MKNEVQKYDNVETMKKNVDNVEMQTNVAKLKNVEMQNECRKCRKNVVIQ